MLPRWQMVINKIAVQIGKLSYGRQQISMLDIDPGNVWALQPTLSAVKNWDSWAWFQA